MAVLKSLYINALKNHWKSGTKHYISCLESRSTKTFEKWYDNFNFREDTLIAFVFRDSYKKIDTTSESLHILKRLSNDLNKLVKSQK